MTTPSILALGYAVLGLAVPPGTEKTAGDDRPTFIVSLRPKPGIDPIKALRGALKVLWRRFGLQATSVEERKP